MEDTKTAARVIAEGGFNTGRLYTANGQQIYWWQLSDGWLLFKDHSRMVHGWIRRTEASIARGPAISPGYLMDRYDHGKFETWCPDHRDYDYRPPVDFDFGAGLRI
ncbi:MAG: hypothetical protein A2792_03570 [Sphingomonadales bacterium RIFCSPHIGHO2_01_FULL_65_20]|nr:MAG: hypothetical protein A2792_03570 [Sphingomonadales bacterium RIFCSPHIGHO2_01_FULL_65_20]